MKQASIKPTTYKIRAYVPEQEKIARANAKWVKAKPKGKENAKTHPWALGFGKNQAIC